MSMSSSGNTDRRTATRRTSSGELLGWSAAGDGLRHQGWVRDVSASGVAFVTEQCALPRLQQRIEVHRKVAHESGRYRVRRCESLSNDVWLVAAERDDGDSEQTAAAPFAKADYLESQPSAAVSHGYESARQSAQLRERRSSDRWLTNKLISWRIAGGSRARGGVVVERSLHGLVIEVASHDAVDPGLMIVPADDPTAQRHGFRSGIVRRVERHSDGRRVMYVELLA